MILIAWQERICRSLRLQFPTSAPANAVVKLVLANGYVRFRCRGGPMNRLFSSLLQKVDTHGTIEVFSCDDTISAQSSRRKDSRTPARWRDGSRCRQSWRKFNRKRHHSAKCGGDEAQGRRHCFRNHQINRGHAGKAVAAARSSQTSKTEGLLVESGLPDRPFPLFVFNGGNCTDYSGTGPAQNRRGSYNARSERHAANDHSRGE